MARFNRSSMFPNTAGTRRTTAIVGKFSKTNYTPIIISDDLSSIQALSGAVTANTLKTLFNLTGTGGRISKLSIRTADATARTIRLVVTVDGAVVYDFTSASVSINNSGAFVAGKAGAEGSVHLDRQPEIVFTTSCKVEFASNLTETDKFTLQYLYNTEA